MDIQWEEPPAHAVAIGERQGHYAEFAAALREHPGKWALLPRKGTSNDAARATAQNIKRRRLTAFKHGQWDTALDGTKIYVRYMGPDDDQEPQESESPESPESPELDEPEEPMRPQGGPTPEEPQAARVRAWAISQGLEVPDRGRLPRYITEKYHEAHPPVRAV